jgi:pimeloyl-ACP methyl ester carboxylesterase
VDEDLEVISLPAHRPSAGPPLLLVHGICHGAWCWRDHYAPFFAEHGHDVHSLSLRGHAGSGGSEALDQAGLADYVEDVLAVARDLPAPPVVVGHSMGGAVVQLAVPRDPGLFAGAVLLAPMVPGGFTLRELIQTFRSPLGQLAMFRLNAGKRISPRETARLPFFSGRLSMKEAARIAPLLQPESRRVTRELLRFTVPGGSFAVPLLVVGSRRDAYFGEAAVTRTAHHFGVEPVLVDECCHDLMLDPDWSISADIIRKWVASVFSARPSATGDDADEGDHNEDPEERPHALPI